MSKHLFFLPLLIELEAKLNVKFQKLFNPLHLSIILSFRLLKLLIKVASLFKLSCFVVCLFFLFFLGGSTTILLCIFFKTNFSLIILFYTFTDIILLQIVFYIWSNTWQYVDLQNLMIHFQIFYPKPCKMLTTFGLMHNLFNKKIYLLEKISFETAALICNV